MKTLQNVCLWAGVLMLSVAPGNDAPPAGVWEGSIEGRRAITLRLRDTNGGPAGSAVFYILKDEGSGRHNGEATPETPLLEVRWDGESLRFSVKNPNGDTIAFVMKITAEGKADLAVLASDGHAQRIIPLRRVP